MKLHIPLLFFFLAICEGQRTVTQDLVDAQNDLTIGHEFSELFLVQNRNRLSDYLANIETQVLNSFMDAYATIKNIGIETRDAMNEFTETSFCKDAVRARWELQVTRYGHRLSECLGVTNGYLLQFTSVLNDLHDESRAYTNQIPNSSINVLSGLDIFDGRDNLQTYINNAYRDLFFRALDWYDDFDAFINEISLDLDNIVHQLTACFRSLPLSFQNESNQDLRSIEMCYGD